MEPEPGQDSDHDGASDPQPGQGSPDPAGAGLPGDAAPPGSPAASSAPAPAPDSDSASSSGASAEAASAANAASDASGADADAGAGAEGESVFGPWDGLEGTLGAAREREELLAGFAPGGVWDQHAPGPELAAAVARAAGPDWRCGLATGPELVGLLRATAALQSWSGAGLLGVIRALIRDDDPAFLGRSRHGDLPDEWDESLVHEIALALAVSAPSAGRTTRAAWELGARLPGVELLLRDGTLDLPRARLVAEVFAELSDENAARAEELLLPELTTPPRKTYTQVERIATAIAAAVDPELAERRRKAAEKHLSRVTMFRESSGAAVLSGRDLPVGETLAAYASLDARARLYQESGAFPGERLDRLRAAAYLDILNGISAADRIACGHLSSDPAPDTDPGDAPDPADSGAPGDGGLGDGPGSGGSDCPCDECDGHCAPPDNNDYVDDEPEDDEPGDEDLGDDEAPDRGGPDDGGPGERELDDREPNDGQPDDCPGNGSPRGGGLPPAPSGRSGDGPTGGSPSRRRRRGIGPPGIAIAVPTAARRPPADADRPGAPARHPPRPGRTARRGTRPRRPRPRPVPCPRRHCSPQPLHHPLRHRHQRRRHRDRPRLRQARPARPTARRTAPAPDRAPGPDQSHRHRRPTGRTTRTAADRASRTYGTSRASRTRTTSWISVHRLGARPPWRRPARRPGLVRPLGADHRHRAWSSPSTSSRSRRSTATTATSPAPTSPTRPSATWSRSATTRARSRPATATHGNRTSSMRCRTTRADAPARATPGPEPQMPSGQAIARLERHPAQTRLAPVDHPPRPHLHPRPQAIPRLSGQQAATGSVDQLVLPLGLGLTLQFEVCLGDLGRLEARGAADHRRDRDAGRVHARPRQLVVKHLHVGAQPGLADGERGELLGGVQRVAAAGEQQGAARRLTGSAASVTVFP